MSFSDNSVGKESTCNAGDPGSFPGLGRSTGARIGYIYMCIYTLMYKYILMPYPNRH